MVEKFVVKLPDDASEEEMRRLATALEPVVLTKIKFYKQFIFEVNNQRAAQIIQAVIDAQGIGNGKKPVQNSEITKASWMNVETKEIVSSYVLNKKLNDRNPDLVNKVFMNHSGVRFIVSEIDGHQKLVKEPQA